MDPANLSECAQMQTDEMSVLRSTYTIDELVFTGDGGCELFDLNIVRARAGVLLDGTGDSAAVDVSSLTDACRAHINSLPLGEPMVYEVATWLREHGAQYRTTMRALRRCWIYSHHIYNATKRKNIVAEACALQLTGFMMAGKPGVVCVEGDEHICDQFYAIIRQWQWQKLHVQHSESIDANEFVDFHEISTDEVDAKSNKSFNMRDFRQFLDSHGLAHVFPILFGIGSVTEL